MLHGERTAGPIVLTLKRLRIGWLGQRSRSGIGSLVMLGCSANVPDARDRVHLLECEPNWSQKTTSSFPWSAVCVVLGVDRRFARH
jgi:hypothetical protein